MVDLTSSKGLYSLKALYSTKDDTSAAASFWPIFDSSIRFQVGSEGEATSIQSEDFMTNFFLRGLICTGELAYSFCIVSYYIFWIWLIDWRLNQFIVQFKNFLSMLQNESLHVR